MSLMIRRRRDELHEGAPVSGRQGSEGDAHGRRRQARRHPVELGSGVRHPGAAGPAARIKERKTTAAVKFPHARWIPPATDSMVHATPRHAIRSISTRASLKQAPPPRSASVSGTSVFALFPFSVCRAQMPAGNLRHPATHLGRDLGEAHDFPEVAENADAFSRPYARAAASSGWIATGTRSARRSSPRVEVIVPSEAGEMSARGYRPFPQGPGTRRARSGASRSSSSGRGGPFGRRCAGRRPRTGRGAHPSREWRFPSRRSRRISSERELCPRIASARASAVSGSRDAPSRSAGKDRRTHPRCSAASRAGAATAGNHGGRRLRSRARAPGARGMSWRKGRCPRIARCRS